jgi:hypothetical protein
MRRSAPFDSLSVIHDLHIRAPNRAVQKRLGLSMVHCADGID